MSDEADWLRKEVKEQAAEIESLRSEIDRLEPMVDRLETEMATVEYERDRLMEYLNEIQLKHFSEWKDKQQ